MGILTSLYNVIKPGGHLIITVPAFDTLWSEHDEINHHKRRYRSPQLKHLIEEAGFTVDRVSYCNTALYVPVLLTRKAKNIWRSISRQRPGEHRPLQSDLGDYPKPINEALYSLMRAETRLMNRFDMPFGVSILAVATRPADSAGARASAPIEADRIIVPAQEQPSEEPVAERLPEAVGAGAGSYVGMDASRF
jgi:hypothetical protein